MMKPIVISLVPFAFLAGCAGEVEMRSVSGQTATMMSTYKSSLQQFANAQSQLNAATEARINRFHQMREARQAEISARADSWRLADQKQALSQLDVLGSSDADEMLANSNPQPPEPGLPALKYESGEVDAVIKRLLELKNPVTLRQRVEHLVTYATAVKESLPGDIVQAAKSTKAVAEQTEQNAVDVEKQETANNAGASDD